MPGPVSATEILIEGCFLPGSGPASVTLTLPPPGVYFRALSIRLMITLSILPVSSQAMSGLPAGVSPGTCASESRIRRRRASDSKAATMFCKNGITSTGLACSVRVPDCICARLSNCSTKFCSRRVLRSIIA